MFYMMLYLFSAYRGAVVLVRRLQSVLGGEVSSGLQARLERALYGWEGFRRVLFSLSSSRTFRLQGHV